MRVALVHDYLNQYGGAERVLEAFCEIWPQAPIFTLVYSRERTGYAFDGRKIRCSFLQKVPLVKKYHRPFLMLMPLGIEQFDLSKYDLVISDSASFAKGVITHPKTLHICYCHTPTRYVWDDSHKYIKEFAYPSLIKKMVPSFLNYLRVWDEAASARPDKYLANSQFVARRIKKYYNREAQVIYPPVKTKNFYLADCPKNYFLLLARFLPYKKVDLAIEAFNRLGWPLKIIGDGPEKKRLKKMAKPNIEFVGLVSDAELKNYFANCRAFVFPQEEDFGITAIEAMSAGRPVVAFRAGGALEFIKENETGIFFEEQSVDALVEALKKIEKMKFNSQAIREHALQFDSENFKKKIKEFVALSLEEHKKTARII
jgi:glycosyltransferase involved in cell wall biosynthesis